MNYEKIYNDLIKKRRLHKIDRTPENKNVEYHHIIPRSCDGIDDPGDAEHNNENYNIVGLTLAEHFFAHLLLQQIYKEKYGIEHRYYKKMIKAIIMMIDYKTYGIKCSKFYEQLRLKAIQAGSMITTAGRVWVTNGKQDIFLKPGEVIPEGFHRGRTICFTDEQKREYSLKISIAAIGRKCWNKGKRGIYSDEYRKKISESHADVSGKNNPRYGSRMMVNIKTQHRILVMKEDIQKYFDNGYFCIENLKPFNNGLIEVLDKTCPDGFLPGKLTKRRKNAIINNETISNESNMNRKWIFNPKTYITKFVLASDIQTYIDQGYEIGRGKFK